MPSDLTTSTEDILRSEESFYLFSFIPDVAVYVKSGL